MKNSDLKEFMERLVGYYSPGCTAVVYKDGKRVFGESAGFADIENRLPMEGDESFYIYSCSKVLTVTAALQLYEKGIFLLDDPVYEYVPEFKDIKLRGTDKTAETPITFRHLFTMTSGLTYDMNTKAFDTAREKTGGKMNTVDVIKELPSDGIIFEPGSRWNYSLSHDVLAGLTEVISGMKFRDYVKKNVLDPLGMENTFYHPEKVMKIPSGEKGSLAKQYRLTYTSDRNEIEKDDRIPVKCGYLEPAGQNNSFIFGEEYDSGGAGVITTAEDYAKFTAALAGKGKGVNGERILSEGTVRLMSENQLTEAQAKDFSWAQLTGYGYGLGVRTLVDIAKSGTTGNAGEFGWGGAAGANVLVDTKENLSMFFVQHVLNPMEDYYQPRVRNVLYTSFR